MKGGIYTEENCTRPGCGLRMKDNHRDAVCCPKHKKERAKTLILKFGRDVKLRFTDYQEASRELTAMRRDTDLNRFDKRDYKRQSPLSFSAMSETYLAFRRQEIAIGKLKRSSLDEIERNIGKASDFFGLFNIRELSTATVRKFELSLGGFAPKTVTDIIGALRAMHKYLVENEEFQPLHLIRWPEANLDNMAMRKTITKDAQCAIIEEVRKLTHQNPRIWLGIRWLSVYTSIRPFELLGILEKDVDLDQGLLTIRNHKNSNKKGPKIVPLLPVDIDILKKLPKGFPEMHLFRRDNGGGGRHKGTPFGEGIFYDYWKKASANLGITDVDLYGGTRHSSQRYYKRYLSKEDCMRLSMHTTSKAGARYLQLDEEELLAGYSLSDLSTEAAGPPPDHRKTRFISISTRKSNK